MNTLKVMFAFCFFLTLMACHGGRKLATLVNGSDNYAASKGTAKVNIQAERVMSPYNIVTLNISTVGNLTFHPDSFKAYGSPAGYVKLEDYSFWDANSKKIDARMWTTGGPTKMTVNIHVLSDPNVRGKNPKMAVLLGDFITYEGAPLTTDTLLVDIMPPALKTP